MPDWRTLTRSVVGTTAASVIVFAHAPTVAHAQTAERQLYVSVLDAAGAPVTDLRTDEFVVREDGVRREVLRAERATAPMQIALLIDNSQAAEPYIRDIREGVTRFVEAMHGQNEIALIAFAERPTILAESTRDLDRLKAGVGRIFAQSGSGSYLLDALLETARGFQRREVTRRVIVVVTTEGIELSTRYYGDVLEALSTAGIALHALVLQAGEDGGFLRDGTRNRNIVLSQGPKQTGGGYQLLLTSMAFESRLKGVAAELSSQYLVVYARPPRLIPPKEIRAAVTRPQLTVRGTPPPGA